MSNTLHFHIANQLVMAGVDPRARQIAGTTGGFPTPIRRPHFE